MQKQEKFEVSITKDFVGIWKEFNLLISKDKEYIRILNKKAQIDKRSEKGRDKSARIRYIISYYVRQEKVNLLEEQFKQKGGNVINDMP